MKQDYYQVSNIQRYPIGFRYPIDHPLESRRWHYSRAGGILTPDFLARDASFQHITWAIVTTPVPVGSRSFVVTVQATDGALRDGAIALNELAGGYCIPFTPLGPAGIMNRRIISNTAVAAPGGAMTIVIDKPTNVEMTAVTRLDCMCSQYANVQLIPADSSYCSTIGVPTIAAVAGQFLWLQTWGPIYTNKDLVVGVGVNNRDVSSGPDANLHPIVAGDAFNTTQGQKMGHVLQNGNAVGRPAGTFVFLMLDP